MEKTDIIVKKYINGAIRHGKALDEGNPKEANRAYKIMENTYEELKQMGKLGLDALFKELDNPNNYVRCYVAGCMLNYKPEEAEKVLIELSNIKLSFVGFNAEITLNEWRKGKSSVNDR